MVAVLACPGDTRNSVPTELVHALSALLRLLAELTATGLVALAMAALLATGARLATLLEPRGRGARTN